MYPDFKKVTTYKEVSVQTSTGTQPVKQLRPCFVNPDNFCYCSGTACEHKPMKMENETEVLRIEGNVTVPKRANNLAHLFEKFLKDWGYTWSGSIVPQDDESGMRLYRVEEVDGLKDQIETWKKIGKEYAEKEAKNNEAFLSLSEELAQEREMKERYEHALQLEAVITDSQREAIKDQYDEIKVLKKRLELKENGRWRTFIKWLNNLWERKPQKSELCPLCNQKWYGKCADPRCLNEL
jgi:hypothetical protein